MRSPGDVTSEPRADLVRYPSASTARLLVLLAAILSAGLYAGNWLHTLTHAGEGLRAVYSIAGAAGVALGGVAILLAAPGVVERRRRLRPVDARLGATTARVAELAQQAGLPRPPLIVLGPARQRDAFSYGAPGRGYRVALPKALAVRPRTAVFESVLRHELAHIAHHDVPLAWLARSLGYALAVLLGVPLIIAVVGGDLSLIVEYVWRSAVLAGVVLLARAAWLRSREHDADLRAARAAGGEPAIVALLESIPEPPRPDGSAGPVQRGRRLVWRLMANHPPPSARAAALREPQRTAPVTFVDGLTVAFLAGLTQPLLDRTLLQLLTGSGLNSFAGVLSAAVVGPLLGATVGLGLWRQALVSRLTGLPARVGGVAAGVFVGLVLGRSGSLARADSTALAGTERPALVLISALGCAGATVMLAGLGELWADAAGRLRRVAGSAVPAAVLAALLFGVVLWASITLQGAQDWFGWQGAGTAAITLLAIWPIAALAVLLAASVVVAGWLGRPGAVTPAWLLDRGVPAPWPARPVGELRQGCLAGVVAGLAGGTAIVGYRVLAGPAADDGELVQRYFGYIWVAAAVGAVTAVVLAMLRPGRGAGVALLAGPVAVLVAQSCFLVLNATLGAGFDPGFGWRVVREPLAIGVLLQVAVAAVALPVRELRPVAEGAAPRQTVTVAAVAALAVLGSLVVPAGRDALAPPPPGVPAAPAAEPASDGVQVYVRQQAPKIEAAYAAVQQAAASIDADLAADGATRAARVRAEVVVPLRSLLGFAERLHPGDLAVAAAHRDGTAALRSALRSMQGFAVGFETGDQTALDQARIDGKDAASHWRAWRARVVILGS